MSDNLLYGRNLSRRSLLSGVGAATITSLAGCLEWGDDTTPSVESLDHIQIREMPDGYEHRTKRLAVLSDDLVDTLNVHHNQQVRVTRPGETVDNLHPSAVYTVKRDADFSGQFESSIWLTSDGMKRMHAAEGWLVALHSHGPSASLETANAARSNSEYIERSIDASGSSFIALAPNGGDIEPNTDLQALRVGAELEENTWTTAGFSSDGRAYDRWYTNEDHIHPASYPQLAEFVRYRSSDDEPHDYSRQYRTAVSFTGLDSGLGIRIGGLAQDSIKEDVREAIASALRDAGAATIVKVEYAGDAAATDPMNIVNRVTRDGHRGIQIAQSDAVRESHWREVADAVIATFE